MKGYPGRGLHGEVVCALGLRIVRGDHPPGSVIDVDALEPELGVSKTVVREALRVLAAKGLVDSRPKRGTFVRDRASWSLLDSDVLTWRRAAPEDDDRLLADLSELRDAIEPAAARIAAQRRTDDDLDAIGAAVDAFADADGDADELRAADEDFHLRVLAATHNELYACMDVVVTHSLGARDQLPRLPERRDLVPDHRAVLDAVRDGDGPRAEAAMRLALREPDEVGSATEPFVGP